MKHMQTLYQRWTPTQIGRHWEEEAEAVVNMLADLSSQSEAETHGDTLGDAEAEVLAGRYLKPYNRRRPRQTVRLCNVETNASVDTRAENLPEGRATTNVKSLGDVKTDKQMEMLVDALAEAEAKTLGATLADVDAKACLTLWLTQ